MKTIINTISFLLFVLTLQSCSFNAIKGNKTIIEKEVSINDYSAIEFSGSASLIYEQKTDAAPYFRIEVDENIYPLLTIEVDNGTLSIGSKENIRPTKYNIYTNSTELKRLEASGSIKAHLKGKLVTDEMNIETSGSATIQIDDLTCGVIRSNTAGSGEITIAGSANEMHCSAAGSGKVKALSMVANNVYCEVAGSGNFAVHAVEYLNVSIAGSGKVSYKGEPKIDQSISGSGKIGRVE